MGAKPSGGLPAGQKLVKDWPVLDLGIRPAIGKDEWRLRVDGECSSPFVLNWPGLQKLPRITRKSDIHCVTSWSMMGNIWQGVATSVICEKAELKSSAKFVWLESYDGYSTNMSLSDFLKEGSMLAYAHQGKAIEGKHGGPLRLVVPHLYFWKSPKWLSKIVFRATDKKGFWEERGYHNRGDPWLEQRYSRQGE